MMPSPSSSITFLVLTLVATLVFTLFSAAAGAPILDQGLEQPCKTGGAIKFGIPWPPSSRPLNRLKVSIDGAPRNIELATSTTVENIVTPQSLTAQSSGTRSAACTTTTSDDALPWFRLDLGETRDVFSVQLTNEGDCCDVDQTNLKMYLNDIRGPSDNPLSLTPSQHSFAFDDRTMCGGVEISRITLGTSKSITCNKRGRYLAITGVSQTSLKLCGIKVFVIPSTDGAAEMISGDASGRRPMSSSSGYLFKNFLRTSTVHHGVRSDGEKNRIDCPEDTIIGFGFTLQTTTDNALRACALSNNGACTPGSTFCETKACTTTVAAGTMTSLVYATCSPKVVVWPPPSRSSVLTHVGDGNAGTIECPTGQVLAFGFGIQWTSFASGSPASRRCLLDNNMACSVGATQCEQTLCRSSEGGVENRDVSFMYGICVRKEELPYSNNDLAFRKSDGKIPTEGGLQHVGCYGKLVAFGFGYQHTNSKAVSPQIQWSSSSSSSSSSSNINKGRLPFNTNVLLDGTKQFEIQKSNQMGRSRLNTNRFLFGGLVPAIDVVSSGDCAEDAQEQYGVRLSVSSREAAWGTACSLFDAPLTNEFRSDWRSTNQRIGSGGSGEDKDEWVVVMLPTKSRIMSYSLTAPSAGTANILDGMPIRWSLEAQESRIGSWVTIDDTHAEKDVGGRDWSLGETRYFAVPTGSMTHSYGWRLRIHKVANSGNVVQLAQIQLYTEDATRSTTSWPRICDDDES